MRAPCRIGLLLLVVALATRLELARCLNIDLNELPPEEDEEEEAEETEAHEERPAAGLQLEPDEAGRAKRRKTAPERSEPPTSSPGSLWAGLGQLPAYFNFDSFKQNFERRYKSAEAYLRRSIFLQKCLAVFKSRVAFRLGKKSYLEQVNQFSDRTPDEFRTMFMAAPPEELAQDVGQARRALAQRLERLERMESANYVPEVASQAAPAGAEGLEGAGLLNEATARKLLTQFIASQSAGESETLASALRAEQLGLGVELESQGCESAATCSSRPLAWPGLERSGGAEYAPEPADAYRAPVVARDEWLDWSRHECFHAVYSQGPNCGKCYVLSTVALAEFYKCSELGPGQPVSRRKFSANYVLDCAQKYSPAVMGCAGGSPLATLKFMAHAGLFNIRDWRLRRTSELAAARQLLAPADQLDQLDLRCPLSPARTPIEQWGSVRVQMNPRAVPANRWKEALADGPLVASVQMPAEGVDTYAGGVHDGRGCATSGAWHAMLLVGYGTSERGQPYWRFRNSFGPDWGDAGHFHLAMEVPGACLPGGVRVYREPLAE